MFNLKHARTIYLCTKIYFMETNIQLIAHLFKYTYDTLSKNPEQTVSATLSVPSNDANNNISVNLSVSFSNMKTTNQINLIYTESIDCDIIFKNKYRFSIRRPVKLNIKNMFIYDVAKLSQAQNNKYQMIKNTTDEIRRKLDLSFEQDLINWVIIHDLVIEHCRFPVFIMKFDILMKDGRQYNAHSFHDFLNSFEAHVKLTGSSAFKITIHDDIV